MIGRLRQLSEPRLRQQAGIKKSQTPVERDILVQWVRIPCLGLNPIIISISLSDQGSDQDLMVLLFSKATVQMFTGC